VYAGVPVLGGEVALQPKNVGDAVGYVQRVRCDVPVIDALGNRLAHEAVSLLALPKLALGRAGIGNIGIADDDATP
jgi:hypothetical protein